MAELYRDYNVATMAKTLHEARIDPQDTLELITKLRRFSFHDEDFKLRHHWGARGELKKFVNYCNEDQERRFQLDGNNHRLHQRLKYVLESCQNGKLNRSKSFAHLAEEACKEFPPL
jgi:hypothetical protein